MVAFRNFREFRTYQNEEEPVGVVMFSLIQTTIKCQAPFPNEGYCIANIALAKSWYVLSTHRGQTD